MVGERVSSHDMQIQYMVGERVSSEIQYMVGERARDSKHEFVDEILNESARQMGFGHRAELRLDSIQNTLGDSIHGW